MALQLRSLRPQLLGLRARLLQALLLLAQLGFDLLQTGFPCLLGLPNTIAVRRHSSRPTLLDLQATPWGLQQGPGHRSCLPLASAVLQRL